LRTMVRRMSCRTSSRAIPMPLPSFIERAFERSRLVLDRALSRRWSAGRDLARFDLEVSISFDTVAACARRESGE
jgi:hypothetical protein